MDSIKQYFAFVRPYWKTIGVTVFIGILKFGLPLMIPLLLKYVVDDLILSDQLTSEEKGIQLAWVMGAVFIIFTVVRYPIEYYRQYFAQLVGNKILYDIRDRLFAHLQKLSIRYYHNNKTGEVISRVIHDVEQTKNFVMTGLMNLWLDFITIIIAIGIMMYALDFWLTIIAISIFPLYGISVKYFYQRLRALTRERSQALAQMQGHLHERVQGMTVVQSFALEDQEQKQFDKQNQHFLKRALSHTSWNAKTFAVVNTITDIAPLLVIAYGGYQAIQGNISAGEISAFLLYLERIYGPLRRLVNSSTTLTQSIASMDRVFELLNQEKDIQGGPRTLEQRKVQGSVQFKQVDFQYNVDSARVLRQINLDVSPGEKIALVGMSGGGKSSLISLLPRFYDVSKGAILLDGVDIREYELEGLRQNIGMVFQDSILFSDSIRENIMMGNTGATEAQMIAAAKAANAHDFIMELPQGYDTPIGERGVKLSGGQKQRVSIARVFLKNPPILILDEATSALDLESEKMIQDSLERLAKDRTTFIVAHRLSTITHADRILLLENGQIVEEGSHLELMNKRGAYYNLYQIQQLDQ
ncbi:ABC transporter ATP-binding protein [Bacillus horti]|uniref:Subfamily B ATP-binding cassette protein MsbA n=1 Tax=Caldalkalibacillus horti TaxID=77523 RepID=A0ABT9W1F5_9BACI|nr:ABC transporter ATP-binding protein [Bacillus horti]MDQ0167069.1 subfamily B ATP-binding cassette protein MsbA [Bacillus horti]